MIQYLRHNEIDRSRWDLCVRNAVNSMVYGMSWYLDLVSPGWEALAEEDYSSVFPLPVKRKYGIPYVAQPFFTQQLGVFSVQHLTPELVRSYVEAIPSKFRLVDLHLNSMNRLSPPKGIRVTERKNHELELISGYAVLKENYAKNVKRNLKKAENSGVEIDRKLTEDELVTLFKENYGGKEGKLQYRHYRILTDIIRTARKNAQGILIGASGRRDGLDAGAFFLKDRHRYIMLLGASDYRTRDNGAMFRVVDAFIKEHSETSMLLDFEGGNEPGLGRFYRSFGAHEVQYPMIRKRVWPFAFSGG